MTLANSFRGRAKKRTKRATCAYWVLKWQHITVADRRTKRASRRRCKSSVATLQPTALLHCSKTRRYNTMQAATLVALLIPVVAIWITVVVRYGRSIEEIVVATVEKEE